MGKNTEITKSKFEVYPIVKVDLPKLTKEEKRYIKRTV